jgi:hypothetical protein
MAERGGLEALRLHPASAEAVDRANELNAQLESVRGRVVALSGLYE